jgi:uncharacterized membrane protein YeiH
MDWWTLGFTVAPTLLDTMAVAVFAVSGALVASRKEMDIFGFVMLGTVTGIGGGSMRDIFLGRLPVFWVETPGYVLICVAAACTTFFTAHLISSRYRLMLWFDAIGLSLFCVTGAQTALAVGAHPLVAIIMGVITGTFGGIIRDVLGDEVSLLLRKEIYVTAALAGATTFVALSATGLDMAICSTAGFLACLTIRGLALVNGWSLPTYKSRPGRPADP